jgi:hypothetical protein
MRCGVNTAEKEVFCSDCLASMEKYPIKPGTPVHIPMRGMAPDAKKVSKKKRDLTPDEQISRLRSMIRMLTAGLMAALVVIMLLSGILLVSSLQDKPQTPSARNYTATEGR